MGRDEDVFDVFGLGRSELQHPLVSDFCITETAEKRLRRAQLTLLLVPPFTDFSNDSGIVARG